MGPTKRRTFRSSKVYNEFRASSIRRPRPQQSCCRGHARVAAFPRNRSKQIKPMKSNLRGFCRGCNNRSWKAQFIESPFASGTVTWLVIFVTILVRKTSPLAILFILNNIPRFVRTSAAAVSPRTPFQSRPFIRLIIIIIEAAHRLVRKPGSSVRAPVRCSAH